MTAASHRGSCIDEADPRACERGGGPPARGTDLVDTRRAFTVLRRLTLRQDLHRRHKRRLCDDKGDTAWEAFDAPWARKGAKTGPGQVEGQKGQTSAAKSACTPPATRRQVLRHKSARGSVGGASPDGSRGRDSAAATAHA